MMAKLSPFKKIHIARICTGLSSTQKCILLVVASHLGKEEFAHLSLSTLMKECSITKRNSIVDNMDFLVQKKIIIKIDPCNGFKSCRYGINFDLLVIIGYQTEKLGISQDLLVTVGYQTSNRRLPDQYPTVTSAVTVGYPKEQLKSFKRNLKKELADKNNGKSKAKATSEVAPNANEELEKIRKTLGMRRH